MIAQIKTNINTQSANKTKKIVVANNHWANIGDAFYQNSLIYDLNQVYGNVAEVISGEEHPCHIDKLSTFCQDKIFNYSIFYDCDWYVLSGPILHKNFAKIYVPLLQRLKEENIKLVLMSVGGLQYDEEEIKICREVLHQYPPYILTTRDTETYKTYKEFAKYAYDGICSAFYSSLQYQGCETKNLGKYIVYSFDVYTEPKITFKNSLNITGDKLLNNLEINSNSIYRLSRLQKFLENFKQFPDSIGEFKIVRLHHRPLIKITPLIYSKPNTFVSLNPYSYLNLIKNSDLTLGTRVHACVTALSYQKPSMLFQKTKRAYLFNRLGLQNIVTKPVILSRDLLEKEHHDFKKFLSEIDI